MDDRQHELSHEEKIIELRKMRDYYVQQSMYSMERSRQHMEAARNNQGRLRDLKHQEDATEYFDNHTVVGPLARLIFQR